MFHKKTFQYVFARNFLSIVFFFGYLKIISLIFLINDYWNQSIIIYMKCSWILIKKRIKQRSEQTFQCQTKHFLSSELHIEMLSYPLHCLCVVARRMRIHVQVSLFFFLVAMISRVLRGSFASSEFFITSW